MKLNELTYTIRGAIFRVYKELGPGLLESSYKTALVYELVDKGLHVETEVPILVHYRDKLLQDIGYRIDVLVNKEVLVEIKSIEALHPVHHKQVLTYLKHAGVRFGFLVNFNTDNIAQSIHRKVMGY